MKRISITLAVGLILLTSYSTAEARGGRGAAMAARGSVGGGFSGAANFAPRPSAAPTRQSFAGAGPNGGSFQASRGGGSFTTQGGATVDYAGRGGSRTGPGGVTRAGGAGGINVTTAGGQEFSKVGRAGGVQGPGGNSVGGSRSFSATNGPAGSGAAFSRGGFASGPNGAATLRGGVASGPNGAGAYRGGAASGPTGMAAFRGGVAVDPNGVVAGRTGVASNGHGTYYRSAGAVRGQGVAVRAGAVGYHGCFTNAWCAKYQSAWYPGRWGAAAAWTAATWSAVANYGGYVDSAPVSYDYGSTVVIQDNSVYISGDDVGTTAEYANQANEIAVAGKEAEAPKEDEWQPLGVFAMVQGEEKTSNNIFQLAINKESIIRGNYYNAVTDTTEPVYGSVDKNTQRVAWMVGDAKAPVYEAGLVNLTEDETSMMIHYSSDRSTQATLFRIQQDGDPSN